MKKALLLLVIAGSLISCADRPGENPASTRELPARLKVMSYNIWNGFDWGKDSIRQENCIRWIRDQDPDVLALQELCSYDEDKLKADAARWGHEYVAILKSEGYPVGLTSKKPIVLKERVLEGLWHGMLHCETFGIDFFVVHLSPADCDFRLREAEIITEKVKNNEGRNFIVLGDFNAHSPFDAELLNLNKSLLRKYSNKKPESEYDNLRLGEFDYSVISAFIAIPAIDLSLNFVTIDDRYTFPTSSLIGIYQTAEEVRQNKERIDYILSSPPLSKECTKVTIFNNEETASFSDHFPLMAVFSLEKEN